MLVLSQLVGAHRSAEILAALQALDHVRTEPPPRKRPTFVLHPDRTGALRIQY